MEYLVFMRDKIVLCRTILEGGAGEVMYFVGRGDDCEASVDGLQREGENIIIRTMQNGWFSIGEEY